MSIPTYRIFIASPGDVQAERGQVETAISRVNRQIGQALNMRFEPFLWERDAFPGYGDTAQELINEQAVNGHKMDAAVFILWHKFGTPTGEYRSGWESEFASFLKQADKDKAFQIMFFVKTEPVSPRRIDGEQLQMVNDFLRQVDGLYVSFDTTEQFKDRLEEALSNAMHKMDQFKKANRKSLE